VAITAAALLVVTGSVNWMPAFAVDWNASAFAAVSVTALPPIE
jgi:hypothetical protein